MKKLLNTTFAENVQKRHDEIVENKIYLGWAHFNFKEALKVLKSQKGYTSNGDIAWMIAEVLNKDDLHSLRRALEPHDPHHP